MAIWNNNFTMQRYEKKVKCRQADDKGREEFLKKLKNDTVIHTKKNICTLLFV